MKNNQLQTIKGGFIASGDVIHLPRVGKITIKRMVSEFRSIGSIHFFCSDGKTRRFETGKDYKVESGFLPELQEKEIYRFDKITGRISIVSHGAFCRGFDDIEKSFHPVNRRISFTAEAIVLNDIENGAVLYTETAVYSISKPCCELKDGEKI